jgi:hypothetical protein
MAGVSIITFKRGFNIHTQFSVPTRFEHWGIYVDYEDETHSQYLYHADKESAIKPRTIYESKPRTWLHESVKKVDCLILVGYSSKLTHEEMDNICKKISKDRIFNTLANNCQEWVKSVLSELVNSGNLSHLSLKELQENNEITPLLGW